MTQYAWSDDEECFRGAFDSREEALDGADGTTECGTVWTGRVIPFEPNRFSLARLVIEHLSEEAFEHAGEAADNFLVALPPAQVETLGERLLTAFMSWAQEHGRAPDFFGVDDIIKHLPAAIADPDEEC